MPWIPKASKRYSPRNLRKTSIIAGRLCAHAGRGQRKYLGRCQSRKDRNPLAMSV